MDKVGRIYELHRLFKERRTPVHIDRLKEILRCSDSTVRRTLHHMQDYLGAPLDYDEERNGWLYEKSQAETYELPGLWFKPDELYALLISHHLLVSLEPGILSEHINPLTKRIEQLLAKKGNKTPDIQNKIRILQMASRPQNLNHFQQVAAALLQEKQIKVLYHGREKDKTTERILSPQRMVYYRSNWYLDAYCHGRQALRTFSLDRLHPVAEMDEPAHRLSGKELDDILTDSYGIFAGKPKHTAILKFTAEAAKWVADEQWHPQQKQIHHKDGSFELHIPYSDPREILKDILKFGKDVTVIASEELRNETITRLEAALEQYK